MIREDLNKNESPLRIKSYHLALRIIKLYQYLTVEKKEYILSKQLLRSGTNPGAMVRESVNAESTMDFIHKLSVAAKETGETEYWLELLHDSGYLSESEFQSIFHDTIEVGKLLTSSIKTKKKNIAVKAISTLILISTVIYCFH
jgi:four helix bundle protein